MAAKSQIDTRQFLDPRWRLSNLYWITDKRGQAVKFEPNSAQLQFLDELHTSNIILKARQLGFTTLCCLIYLDACVFNPNTRAGVIAHKLDDAKVIFRDKIKFPYDQLPEQIRANVPATQDSADTLTFANNSSVRVSTSMRSGTLQYLHVSEFGKICAQYPEKAREIVTGALNAIEPGQFVVIESTAEGQEGKFYDMTQEAMSHKAGERFLTPLDFKFHFFPWWQEPTYQLARDGVVIGEEYLRYFDSLEAEGIKLTEPQKAWYVKKDQVQGGDMKREFPSTPEEAFEQALEGAYFTRELDQAMKQGRIGGFPVDPTYPVNTFWDLGRNDLNTIWLHQYIRGFHRFVGYYENSGEFVGHYVAWLKEWASENGAQLGEHYLPHDGNRQSLWLESGTLDVMDKLKFHPTIVQRAPDKMQSINQARPYFARSQFDEQGCSVGLKRLRAFRKDWDDIRGVWKDRPRHDINSHGADGWLTFSSSGFTETEVTVPSLVRDRHRDRFRNRSDTAESWMTA
ncbi:terminase [Roseibium sp.]|uniref:terminase n=1 Tax=Roseibium sp. TaxID=1936156 RepID=UPI003278D609